MERVGQPMKQLPDHVTQYRSTPEFTEATLPGGLRGAHRTRPGVWGRIRVLEGELLYRILEPIPEELLLTPERPGVVEPAVAHQVEPRGPVRFRVEFLR